MRLIRAATFSQRLAGWFRHAPPDLHHGLWIQPCNAVHTLGLRHPISVVFLDRQGQVLWVVSSLKPWRFAFCLRADSVVELRPGALDAAHGGMARLTVAIQQSAQHIA